ncbi:DUF1275 family protein [Bradyrhizobium sp. CIAT3101]|uniref:YoaK family protein n=1 Tax=Bradyrhizobium sp. CIAT3101 TaxID=439387 RepID=UPI0024B2489D|nr:DUF1275 family protein [Bradyrhizobium sp. CIAT3101]WFU78231.1 DUF1275 family protein [Bradyrhizobium sp. CIAT3101]
MPLLTQGSAPSQSGLDSANEAVKQSRLEARLLPLLGVIAGMVDFTGFFTLGHIFTAHVTGNIVLATVVAIDGGSFRWAQLSALPVFMIALATVWLIAQASGRHGSRLARLLLQVQFLVLLMLLIFSVITKPSADPAGLNADAAATMAVSAMACQYALLRLALPGAISTAVMTGNLTNAVLSAMDLLAARNRLLPHDSPPLNHSLFRLLSFILGCIVAAGAVLLMGDWAWSLPAALAGIAVALD